MDMMLIACELVIAVCTLVYLFSLQHSVDSGVDGASQHKRRDMAFGFLSLACTSGVLFGTVIGADKLARVAHTVWTRVGAISVHSVPVLRPRRRRSEFSTSVGVVPVPGDEAVGIQEAGDDVLAQAG